jgi:hypothetical protein
MSESATDWTQKNAARSPSAQHPRKKRRRVLQQVCLAVVGAAGLCLPCSTSLAEPAAPAPAIETKPVVGGPDAAQPVVQATAPAEQPALASPTPVVVAPPPEKAKRDVQPEYRVPTAPAKIVPTLKIGMGVRSGLGMTVHSSSDHVKLALHDGLFDGATVRPYLSSQLTDHIGVTANLDVETSGIHLLDAIIQLKFIDELQLWVGQHIPAQDRNNFCGPFFNNSWNFAVTVQAYPMDFAARDRGFTFWGLIAGGILKYHLSMVDLQADRNIANARYGGRLTLNLLGKENYYYSSGTYFGAQDTLAIGGAFQYQNGPGAKGDNDFLGFSADALFEKNLHSAGTITFELGYWNFDKTGKNYKVNPGVNLGTGNPTLGTQFSGPNAGQSMLAAVSWLSPSKVGIGQLQPNFRIQWGDKSAYPGGDGSGIKVYDLGLAYVVDGFNNKWYLNYRHTDPNSGKSTDMFQLGAQLQI